MLSPICLFTYNRLQETQQTVEALKANFLAKDSELFIFSDGSKNELDQEKVNQVRAYLKTIDGFLKVTIFESKENKGLANSIIKGVTQIINEYEKVIVLEDDIYSSMNFLVYMNQCLDKYKNIEEVYSIGGYSFPNITQKKYNYDIYFTKRGTSWGWSTWKNRWNTVNWDITNYKIYLPTKKDQKSFNNMGTDLSGMLKKQCDGKIDSWYIRWIFNQYKHNKFSVLPTISKVQNNGLNTTATHTKNRILRFKTTLDYSNKIEFNLPDNVTMNRSVFKKFTNKYSIISRAYFLLLDYLNSYFKFKN